MSKASEFEAVPCPDCGCALTALYQVTISAPYPFEKIGLTKTTIKSRVVGVVATTWETAQPFCANCGWHGDDSQEAGRSEVILRLMRELITRGVPASEVQRIVGPAVSSVDVLAATYPKIASDD